MNAKDIRPVEYFIARDGAKMIGYGGAGCGKTPTCATAPRPLYFAIEPGRRSLLGSKIPTILCDTAERVDDALKWATESSEAKNYDTFCIDSFDRMMELFLLRAKSRNANLMKAYGVLEDQGRAAVDKLFYMPQKHIYAICQLGSIEENEQQITCPTLPGKALNKYVPHLFDQIGYFSRMSATGYPVDMITIRFQGTHSIRARDRTGLLAEVEWPDIPNGLPNLTRIFNKLMGS